MKVLYTGDTKRRPSTLYAILDQYFREGMVIVGFDKDIKLRFAYRCEPWIFGLA